MHLEHRMTPRERVVAAINHRVPDRVPFSWGFGPTPEMGRVLTEYFGERGIDWARLMQATDDIVRLGPRYVGPSLASGTDIWGIGRMTTVYGGGSYDEIAHCPLADIETAADTDAYPWPDARHLDYSGIGAQADDLRAVCVWGGNPFETYSWMTGIEEAMIRLASMPDVVFAALDHITTFFEGCLRAAIAELGSRIAIVFLADDLGGQNGLLLSIPMYEHVIQPFHKRLNALVRDQLPDAKVMFHTDGDVFAILPSLIESGVDILEAVQTDCPSMIPETLKSTFGDQIAFHGAISVQSLLPFGSRQSVVEGCTDLVSALGQGGGYIAAPSHAIQMGTPPENVEAMLTTILGLEDYNTGQSLARL